MIARPDNAVNVPMLVSVLVVPPEIDAGPGPRAAGHRARIDGDRDRAVASGKNPDEPLPAVVMLPVEFTVTAPAPVLRAEIPIALLPAVVILPVEVTVTGAAASCLGI